MIAMDQPTLTKLEPDDPDLVALVKRGLESWGDVPRYLPTHWLGVRAGERLYACVGLMTVTAGIRIDYLLFDGTFTGFRQMLRLADAINEKFAHNDVFFNTRSDNRWMRAFFESRGCEAEYIGYRRKAR